MKIETTRLIKIKKGRNPKNALVGEYEVVISGLPENRDEIFQAIFGSFHIKEGKATYTATVYTGENGKIYHNYESEFNDDYECLRN